jgi:hypothetical protein
LWGLIALAIYYCVAADFESGAPPSIALSAAAYLPWHIVSARNFLLALKTVTIVLLALWAANRLLPWSAVIGSFGMFATMSVIVASQNYTHHENHTVSVLLVIYALREIFRQGSRAADYPEWVYRLSLLYLTSCYTFSGITKILNCGVGWANGVSLQLWCREYASGPGIMRNLCLWDTSFAAAAQALVLFAETTAIAAFLFPGLRRFYGIVLISFHVSVELIFDYGFYGLIFSDLMFFLLYPRDDISSR